DHHALGAALLDRLEDVHRVAHQALRVPFARLWDGEVRARGVLLRAELEHGEHGAESADRDEGPAGLAGVLVEGFVGLAHAASRSTTIGALVGRYASVHVAALM